MEVFSLEFLAFLLIAVAFVTYRARKKRSGPTIIHGKQITIRGQQIRTPLERSTPLACLLDDGKRYGDDFKDKHPPELPHAEGCQCGLTEMVQHSHDLFNEKKNRKTPQETFSTNLGELNRDEYRLYKYILISNHKDADENIRKDFAELAEQITVPEEVKEKFLDQTLNENSIPTDQS